MKIRQITILILHLFFLVSGVYSQKSVKNIFSDSNLIAYFKLDNNLIDESKNKINLQVVNNQRRITDENNKLIYSYETKFVSDRFGSANKALTTKVISIKTDEDKNLNIKDGFTTSFWFKIDYKRGNYVQLLKKGIREMQKISLKINYGEKENIIEFNVIQKIDNKNIITGVGYLTIPVSEFTEDKWNFLICSFDNSNLNLQVNNEKNTYGINHVKYKDLKNDYDFKSFATTDGMYEFLGTDNESGISLDDIAIWNRSLNSEEIGYLYSDSVNSSNRKKNKPIVEFNSKKDVLNFLNNKIFKKTSGISDSLMLYFMDDGQTVRLSNRNVNYKVGGINIMTKQWAFIDYYDYDERLFTELDINCKDYTVSPAKSNMPEGIPGGDANGVFYFSRELISKELEKEGWQRKGISKLQLLNPKTGNWDEIMFTNPLKFIDIRNNKDVLIEDLDLLSVLVGSDKIGLYKAARFVNGEKVKAELEKTDKFEGLIELLDNNKISSNSEKAVVYFFYDKNNSMGCIQIDNYFCKCKARIFVGKYGMRFE